MSLLTPDGQPPVGLTFTLAGFSKCGTTSLSAALQRHPRVLMPLEKEPWFFSHAVLPDAWPDYIAQFPNWPNYLAVGDDSTTYTAHQCVETAAQRMAELYPNLKVLLIARDPIDRIESSFREMQHSNHLYGLPSPATLDEALITQPQLLADSCYFACSQAYRELFAPDQVKVVFLEDLHRDETAVVNECLRFIGVDPNELPAVATRTQLNSAHTKYRDTAALRWLRTARGFRRVVAWRGDDRQEQLLRGLRLRRPASAEIQWSETSRKEVQHRVAPDARRFLEYYDPTRHWPRLTQLLDQE